MPQRSSASRSFFPWERRGGFLRRAGLHRLRPLLATLVAVGFVVVIAARERQQSGIRRTRALLLDVRRAVDGYLADHDGQCPPNFELLADYGNFRGVPLDAWGNPLTLICPGTRPGQRYRLVSAGPDGLPEGRDRIE